MYQIKMGDSYIFDMRDMQYTVADPILTRKTNHPGSLSFILPVTHPAYNNIIKLKSIMSVYRDETLIWEGRVMTDDQNIALDKAILCEGVLGYLYDSIIRPFTYQGSLEGFFAKLINEHNAHVNEEQRFILGNVTVTDANDYISRSSQSYLSTWEAIKSRLIDTYGGYLVVRYVDGLRYLDYLVDYPNTSTQVVQYGENLVKLSRKSSSETTYTACVPQGCLLSELDETDESGLRLNIESVNDGKDYLIDQTLAQLYGVIFAPVSNTTWEDVTLPQNLKTKGLAYLTGQATRLSETISATVIDLSIIDKSLGKIEFGDHVQVTSPLQNINATYLVSESKIYLSNEAKNTVTLGTTTDTYLDTVLNAEQNFPQQVQQILSDGAYTTKTDAAAIANEAIEKNTSILQSAEQIMLEALQEYSKTQDLEAFRQTVQTQLSVMAGEINMVFNTTTSQISNLSGSTSQQFEQISKYIRFVDGSIILGRSDSMIKLKMSNDIIYFFSGGDTTADVGTAFAYFASNKLTVKDVLALNSLAIGQFSWVPESNGSLSLVRIG